MKYIDNLQLSPDLLYNGGNCRNVYKPPIENDFWKGKCIKVDMIEKMQKRRAKNKTWYKRLRPLKWAGENDKELKYYEKLNKKNPEIFNHIPKFYGVAKTNYGDGLVVDYINNAMSIKNYIKLYGVDERFLLALKNFIDVVILNKIEIRDLHSNNYLVKLVGGGGATLFIIDGLGNGNILPLSEIFPYLGKKRAIKKTNKLLQSLKNDFPEYREKFVF